jgi:flagellar biosynthesis/type III secretory pathway protein FliH
VGGIANSLTQMAFLRQNRRTRQAIERKTAREGSYEAGFDLGYRSGFAAGLVEGMSRKEQHDRD